MLLPIISNYSYSHTGDNINSSKNIKPVLFRGDIQSCDSNNKTVCKIFKYLKNNSPFKDYQIYAIIASAYRESSLNHRVGKSQYGLFQWTHERSKSYSRVFHSNIRDSSIEQQLAFFLWEINNKEKKTYNALLKSDNFQQASIIMVTIFERPKNKKSAIKKQAKIYKQIIKRKRI